MAVSTLAWIGRCTLRSDGDIIETVVAVAARDETEFFARLNERLSVVGYGLHDVLDVRSFPDWLARYGHDDVTTKLAFSIDAADNVSFSSDLTGTGSGSASGAPPRSLQNEILVSTPLADVEPLDAQFGIAEKKSVPAGLSKALFGPTDAVRGDKAATYAVLDAAKVPGLPEMLTASGLDHECLLQGKARDELRNAAPYLVRLDPTNTFTRHLFTRSNDAWHLWDREPGLYMRHAGSMEDVRRHFRRFTRLRHANGSWFYFRFWDSTCFEDFIRSHDEQGGLSIFKGVDAFVTVTRTGSCVHTVTEERNESMLFVTDASMAKYTKRRRALRIGIMADAMPRSPELETMTKEEFRDLVGVHYGRGTELGFKADRDIYRFVLGNTLIAHDRAKCNDLARLAQDGTVDGAVARRSILRQLDGEIAQFRKRTANAR